MRFALIPLWESNQSLAVIGELIVDPNTGHISIKKDESTIVSKTKDTQQSLDNVLNTLLPSKVDKAGSIMTGFLTLSDDPEQPYHAATKSYVDAISLGLQPKDPAKYVSRNNITLFGLQPIDGQNIAHNDRILVTGQTNKSENGIYLAKNAASWVRTTDADADGEVNSGMYVFVEEGDEYKHTGWVLNTTGIIEVGVTPLSFVQFSNTGFINPGTGLYQDGNTLHLTNTGVVAGIYTKVTVDLQGRITFGTNPTTLTGYGITDAISLDDTTTVAVANKLLFLDNTGKLPADITGDASTLDGEHGDFYLDWTNFTNKPVSTASDLDLAVIKSHTQNTDTGTTSNTFNIDSNNQGGIQLKHTLGKLDVLIGSGTDWADIVVKNITIMGETTIIGTETLQVDDNKITLNTTVTGQPSLNAYIEVERGDLTNASFMWNELSQEWYAGLLGSERAIAYEQDSVQKSGDTMTGDLNVIRTENGAVQLVLKNSNTSSGQNRISRILMYGNDINVAGTIVVGTSTSNVNYMQIGTLTNTYMTFNTNSSERVRITSLGNVGIGEQTPVEKLHVKGNVLVKENNPILTIDHDTSFGSGQSALALTSSGVNSHYWRIINSSSEGGYGEGLHFEVDSSSAPITLKSSGRLGIGTNSPQDRLDVVGNIRLSGGGRQILFSDTGNYDFSIVHNAGVSLDFKSPEYGANAILSIHNNGRVGIGVQTPASSLEIRDTTNSSMGIRFTRPANDNLEYREIYFDAEEGTKNPRAWIRHYTDTDANLHYVQFSSAYSTQIGFADWNFEYGNIGIGVVTPSARLHIRNQSGDNLTAIRLEDMDYTNPFTSVETLSGNTYMKLGSISATDGGGMITGYSGLANIPGILLKGYVGSATPTIPGIVIRSGKLNGTNISSLANSELVYQLQNHDGSSIYQTVLGNGNMGLGTVNPLAKFHIEGNVDGEFGQYIINTSTNANSYASITLGHDLSGGNYGRLSHMSPNSSISGISQANRTMLSGFDTGGLGIGTISDTHIDFGTNNTFRMRITNAGKLGIGIDSPVAGILHLVSESGISPVYIDEYNNASTSAIIFRTARGTKLAPTATTIDLQLGGFLGRGYYTDGTPSFGSNSGAVSIHASENYTSTAQGSYIKFSTTLNATTTQLERMRISDSGNIGIGTASPKTKLHVSNGAIITDSGYGVINYGVGVYTDVNTEFLQMYHNGSAFIDVNKTGTGTYRPLYIKTGGLLSLILGITGAATFISTVTGTQLISNVATGTAPLQVTSTTKVTNLNADYLDDLSASDFSRNTGTTSDTFQLLSGSNGVKIKSNSGALEVRNAADNDWADIVVKNLTVQGTQTIIHSETLTIADNIVVLNSNFTTGTPTENSGFEVKRGDFTSASLVWDETLEVWKAGLLGSESPLALAGSHTHTNNEIVTFLGYTPVNKAGDTMSGDLNIVRNTNGSSMFMAQNTNTTSGEASYGRLDLYGNGTDVNLRLIAGRSAANGLLARIATITNTDLELHTNNGEKWRLTATGNVGHGIAVPEKMLHMSSDSSTSILLSASADSNVSEFYFRRSRGTNAAKTAIIDNSTLGIIYFQAYDGTNNLNASYISSSIDGTPGTNDIPSKIVFGTTSDGLSSPSERMRLTKDGNLGINTINPSCKLHVVDNNGLFRIENNTTDANLKVGRLVVGHYTNAEEPMFVIGGNASNGANSIFVGGNSSSTNAATEIVFYTAANSTTLTGTERMRIDASGNIGIGTSSPQGPLHIKPPNIAGTQNGIILEESGIASGQGLKITWRIGDHSNIDLASIYGSTNATGASLVFATNPLDTGSPVERMVITNSGNFGIGTTNPLQKFVIEDSKNEIVNFTLKNTNSTVDQERRSQLSVSGDNGGTSLHIWSGKLVDNSVECAVGSTWNQQHALQFFTYNGTSFSERMRISSGGNVGIGTNNPAYKLHVSGSVGSIIRATDSTVTVDIQTGSLIGSIGTVTNHAFGLFTNNTNRLHISDGGYVGIGNTSPSVGLHLGSSGITAAPRVFTIQDVNNASAGGPQIVGNWYASNYWGLGTNSNTNDGYVKLGSCSQTGSWIGSASLRVTGDLLVNSFGLNNSSMAEGNLTGFVNGNPIARVTGILASGSGEIYKVLISQRGTESYAEATFIRNASTIIKTSESTFSNNGITAKINGTYNSIEFYSSTNPTVPADTVVRVEVIVGDSSKSAGIPVINPGATNLTNPVDSTFSSTTKAMIYGSLGINTTSPARRFHLVESTWDNIAGSGAIFENSNAIGSGITLKPSASVVTNGSNGWALYAGGPSSLVGDGNVGLWAHGTNIISLISTRNGRTGVGSFTGSSVTIPSTLQVYENTTATDASAGLTIEQAGTGDALLQFLISGLQRWSVGIDNSDSDKFKIGRGAGWNISTSLTIDANDNIGIGTFLPGVKLDVVNNANSITTIRVTNTDTTNSNSRARLTAVCGTIISVIDSITGTGTWIGSSSPHKLLLGTNGAERMTIDTSGNVGIGTSSPGERLDVTGGDVRIWNTGGVKARLELFQNGVQEWGIVNVATSGNFSITKGTDDVSTMLSILNSNGNVGIGAITPSEKLEVAGNIKANKMIVKSESTSNTWTLDYNEVDNSLDFIFA
jgi:hypothetical protein